MRTVYVDVLIVVNMFIDFMLLICVQQFLRLKASYTRLIIAGAAGGCLSLVALLPEIPVILNIIMDILFAALLIWIAFGKADFKSFLKRTVVFFSVSFSFCGIMVFIYTTFKPKGMEIYNDVIYFNISPLILIILTLLCYYIMRLIKKFSKGTLAKPVCFVKIYENGILSEFRALVDSGCELKEPFSGEYVIIAEKSLLKNEKLSNFGKRIIPFESLGGSGYIEGIRVDKIYIDEKEISNKIYIGLCENILTGDIKAIVPFEITKNL